MYTLLIVDDEKEIREGLKTVIPWNEYGINVVLTADDGDTALSVVKGNHVDIILTDIKMNRMTGLEFIKNVYQDKIFAGKSIVISGYDDFESVKEGMKLGVMDYILKPINIDELQQIVKKAINHIQAEQFDKQNQLFRDKQLNHAIPQLQEQFLRGILDAEHIVESDCWILDQLKSVQMEWLKDQTFALLVLEVDDLKAIEEKKKYRREKELVIFGVGNVINQTLKEECFEPFALFADKKERWVLLVNFESNKDLEVIESLAKLIIERLNKYVKVNVTISISPEIDGLYKLYSSYQKAIEILERKVIIGGNRLIGSDDLEEDNNIAHVTLKNIAEVVDLIKYGTEIEIKECFSAFSTMVKSWSFTNIKDIQQHTFEWLIELFKKAEAAGWKERWREQNLIAVWEQMEQFDTLDSLQKCTMTYVIEIARSFKASHQLNNQIITEAEAYISKYYADNLTLQLVADHVHITPVWLSKLFKKEKKTPFLEYLTAVRIDKAKLLLNDLQFRIYQVAQEVGYKDSVHFTKIFKKIVGYTPKEYRNMRGIHEE
jgi:two-component system response regulator YesN